MKKAILTLALTVTAITGLAAANTAATCRARERSQIADLLLRALSHVLLDPGLLSSGGGCARRLPGLHVSLLVLQIRRQVGRPP